MPIPPPTPLPVRPPSFSRLSGLVPGPGPGRRHGRRAGARVRADPGPSGRARPSDLLEPGGGDLACRDRRHLARRAGRAYRGQDRPYPGGQAGGQGTGVPGDLCQSHRLLDPDRRCSGLWTGARGCGWHDGRNPGGACVADGRRAAGGTRRPPRAAQSASDPGGGGVGGGGHGAAGGAALGCGQAPCPRPTASESAGADPGQGRRAATGTHPRLRGTCRDQGDQLRSGGDCPLSLADLYL